MPSAPRRSIFTFFLTALVALGSQYASAQKLPLKTFTTADGLATSIIHFTMRDSDGFLWFVGRGGMSRFDGHDFVSFKLEDQSAPLVHQVLESRDGRRFWISTDNGLYRVERSAETPAVVSDQKISAEARRLVAKKVANSGFWALYEEADGRLLAGADTVSESGDPNGETVEFKKVGLRDGVGGPLRIRDIVEGSDGSVWVASDQGLLRRLPNRNWVIYTIPKVYGLGNESGRLAIDRKGNIWLPVRSGVFVLHPEPPEALTGLPNQHEISAKILEHNLGSSGMLRLPENPGEMVRLIPSSLAFGSGGGSAVYGSAQSVFRASDDRIWFATSDGVYVVDGESYSTLRDSSSRPGPGFGITEDAAGNIWFATSNGAIKLVNGGMTSYEQTSGLIDPSVFTIHEMPDGSLVVAHGTWRVSEISDTGITTARLNLPDNARLGWTSFPTVVDSKGSMWVLENFGIYVFDYRTRLVDQALHKPRKVDDRSPYRAWTDRQGRLWVTGNNSPEQSPLRRFDPATGESEDFSGLEGFPVRRGLASFTEDKLGRVWFGMYGGGIVRLENGRFRSITVEDGLPRGSIFDLLIDRGGRLWIASTEDGVRRVDDPLAEKLTFTSITENEGLSSNNVRCLVEDNDGNVYAGTVRGVNRIDATTDEVRVFTTADGLAADFVQTAFRDRKGTIWFGTSGGLSKYEPTGSPTTRVGDVFIGSLQIAGNDYRISEFGQRAVDGLDLSSSENNIRISFTSVGDKTNFQYKLEGSNEQDWTAPASERTLNFANLSPGNYKLLVRAANATDREPASVAFTIRPPFWRSWWFVTLAFLFVAGSVIALDRYRVSKTRQVRTALARSVESETRFRTLAETASDAIITIDAESTIVYVNEAVERVFGYLPSELIGKKLTSLMPERMRGGHEEGLARFIRTSSKNIPWNGVSLPGLHKDGHEIPLELSFGEFEREGKRYFTGIARDVTERMRAEEEIRRGREERLRELQRVRTRIATDLHDDIGSSLTQIAVLSEVARGQASHLSADGVSAPLDRIKTVSKELVAVMSDVVWAINPQKDYLSDLVQRMRRFGSDVLSGRNIAFEFHAPDADDSTELGANIRREVFAIFKESVNNAVKYAECSTVRTDFVVSSESLTLAVSDNGRGFDTKYVLSDEFKPDMGGNGLASIKRRAIELGGDCDIKSTMGKGTEIRVKIPLGGPPE